MSRPAPEMDLAGRVRLLEVLVDQLHDEIALCRDENYRRKPGDDQAPAAESTSSSGPVEHSLTIGHRGALPGAE
jgi:hypothetical protein